MFSSARARKQEGKTSRLDRSPKSTKATDMYSSGSNKFRQTQTIKLSKIAGASPSEHPRKKVSNRPTSSRSNKSSAKVPKYKKKLEIQTEQDSPKKTAFPSPLTPQDMHGTD